MNLPYFIARRITNKNQSSFSSVISRIAMVSIAVGLGAMILSFFILGGFQQTIKNKIFNFKGHLEVTRYNFGNSAEEPPISINSDFYQMKDSIDFIEHVQDFAYKAGLLKTKEEVQGVVFKGVGQNFDSARFKQNMLEGELFQFKESGYSQQVVISKIISKTLRLKVGDKVFISFVQNPPRTRRLEITGIYETGLEEFDKQLIIGDIGLVRRMNNWPDSLVGGHEVFIKDAMNMAQAEEDLFNMIDMNLFVDKVSDKYVQIFDWLNLLNQNVAIFLGLILIVGAVNMISILLILIMERTNMIGVLQALGAPRRQIKRIFLFNGMILIVKGLFWGNVFGLLIAFLQDQFKIIPLDPENYYMYFVPIHWDFGILFGLNVLTFFVVSLALGIPTIVVSRIKPIAAIKFD
ncbi:MAG: ABC transporter permease [Cyclobacteriaceae bacterium]